MSGIIIAIDGYSACGKSTLAKDVAKHFGYLFIDSGAMYRAVTLYALQNNLIQNDVLLQSELINDLPKISLTFRMINGSPKIHLNGVNVDEEIRRGDVPNFVSQVATIREVRIKLVNEQREMAALGGIVMDGRDIGTVVFPNAELKIFVTAKSEVRVKRRWQELKEKGTDLSLQEIEKNLMERDYIDTHRTESPLRKAEDAILFDNSDYSKEEQLNWVINQVNQLIINKNLF